MRGRSAHWGVIAGADFFTTEVWTWRGLVHQIVGSTSPELLRTGRVMRDVRQRQIGSTE